MLDAEAIGDFPLSPDEGTMSRMDSLTLDDELEYAEELAGPSASSANRYLEGPQDSPYGSLGYYQVINDDYFTLFDNTLENRPDMLGISGMDSSSTGQQAYGQSASVPGVASNMPSQVWHNDPTTWTKSLAMTVATGDQDQHYASSSSDHRSVGKSSN